MYEPNASCEMNLNISPESAIGSVLSHLNNVALTYDHWVVPRRIEQNPDGTFSIDVALVPIRQRQLPLGGSAIGHRLADIIASTDTPGTKLTRCEKFLLRVLLKNAGDQLQIDERVYTLHQTRDHDGSHTPPPTLPVPVNTPGTGSPEETPPVKPIGQFPNDAPLPHDLGPGTDSQQQGTTLQEPTPKPTLITEPLILVGFDMKRHTLHVRRKGEQAITVIRVENDDWSKGLDKLLPAEVQLTYRRAETAHGSEYVVEGRSFRAGMAKVARVLRTGLILRRVRKLLD